MSLNQHNDGSESLKNASTTEDGEGDLSNSKNVPPVDIQDGERKRKNGEKRHVKFPSDDSNLITGYLEPVNPWQSVGEISGSELIKEYVASCAKHNTNPQEIVLDQLKEYVYLGASRSGVLSLSSHPLIPAQCEALEAVLRRARFNRIEVCNAALTDETAVALFDMLEYYESTCELDISHNTDFNILGWQACSRMVNKSQYLEQLEARGTSLSENTAPVLGRGLRSPCALRVLHLQRAGLRGRPMLCLASALKQNKSIRELHIGDNNLCPEDANYLASLLRCNTFLQLLDISNNDIQDLGVEHIADALSEQSTPSPSPSTSTSTSSNSTGDSTTSSPQSVNSNTCHERGLAVLVMWNNNLTRNSGYHLSKALSRCKSLEVLNIGQNPLGGETINRVRVALQQNRSLLCLGVQGARLGAEAGVALAEVIEDNQCIQRIDLRDNKLQTAGLLALATALRKNFALTRLDLDDGLPSHNNGMEQQLEEARLVDEIRSLCKRNEIQQSQQNSTPSTPTSEENLHRRRVASFSTRKISLTCQTLHKSNEPISDPVLSPPKMPSGRLRSPLPSPVPSPASSPIPSPSHRSRFTVSRVSDSSSVTSESSSPSTPPSARNFFPNSRFKVVSVQEPPKINVTMAPEEIKSDDKIDIDPDNQADMDLNKNICVKELVEVTTQEEKLAAKEQEDTSVLKEDKPTGIVDVEGDLANSKLHASKRPFEEVDTTNDVPSFMDTSSNIAEKQHFQEEYPVSPIKKNRSELSLDSPDLEVSRLMLKKENYDSNSSLELSGSSMESLNNIESNNVVVESNDDPVVKEDSVFHVQDETEDVFPVDDYKNPFICSVVHDGSHNRKKLSASSNESSLESSTFEAGVIVALPHHTTHHHNTNLLNSSVSSNESVSPNIFGKHMKLHGSVTSLEASISSLDSYKNRNDFISPQNPSSFTFPALDNSQLLESVDSGISQSDTKGRTPSFNESFSSNDGTLTSSSNNKSSIFSMGGDSSLSIEDDNEKSFPRDPEVMPRRVTSLLDVPSMQKSPRVRKISWVAPSNFNQALQHPPQADNKEEEPPQQTSATQSKVPSSLEKLLSLFQHPASLFSRSDTIEKKSNDSSQSSSRRDSQTSMSSGSFWPWNTSNSSINSKVENKSATIGAIERLKKYGESFETALQFSSDVDKKPDLHLSKSDTYLENKDSDRTLTNDMADRLKTTLLARAADVANSNNSVVDSSVPQAHLPPVYSVDSDYCQQTLATCVIHPFQCPNTSANFSIKLHGDKPECMCDKYQNDNSNSTQGESSTNNEKLIDKHLERMEIMKAVDCVEDFTVVPDILDNEFKTVDKEPSRVNLSTSDSNKYSDSSIPFLLDSNVSGLSIKDDDRCTNKTIKQDDECNKPNELERCLDIVEEVNKQTRDIHLIESERCLPRQYPCEMGSVFKFHDLGEQHTYLDEDENRVEMNELLLTHNDKNETNKVGESVTRTLTDSERQNINEIVRNVCEEAVKSVAAKSKRKDANIICDRSTLSGTESVANTSDSVNSANTLVVRDGASAVQIGGWFDCDNNYILNKNKGCLCDSNDRCFQCKYVDSNIVNKDFDNDADLIRQISSDKVDDRIVETDTVGSHLESDLAIRKANSKSAETSNFICDNNEQPTNTLLNSDKRKSIKLMISHLDDLANDNKLRDVTAVESDNSHVSIISEDMLSENVKKDSDFILDLKKEIIRPTELAVRTTPPKQITMVLKQSIGLDNKALPNDRQLSPETGPSVSNLPSKIIQRIKENVSPENTLTSSMSNTTALAQELMERKKELGANTALWEIGLKENVAKILEAKNNNETEDLNPRIYAELLVEPFDKYNKIMSGVLSPKEQNFEEGINQLSEDFESSLNLSARLDESSSLGDVDQGSDALTVKALISDDAITSGNCVTGVTYILDEDESVCDSSLLDINYSESGMTTEKINYVEGPLEPELCVTEKGVELTEQDKIGPSESDTQPKLDQQIESIAIDIASDVISNELNQVTQVSEITDSFQDPSIGIFEPVSILRKATPSVWKAGSLPQNIPEATKPYYHGYTLPTPKKLYDASGSKSSSSLPMRCGSLPENSSLTLSGNETLDMLALNSRPTSNLKSPIQSKLGKLARDSLFALNMSEEELKEYRSSARLSSMDSVRSLGSLSEDLEGLSSSSYVFHSSSDRESILEQGASQDSLISLESISENVSECDNEHKTYDSV